MLTYKVKTAGQILLVPLEDLLPAENSYRLTGSAQELATLAHSISVLGMLNPITVVPCENGLYRVVCGERRRLAAGIAGLDYVPCLIINAEKNMLPLISLADNIHRRGYHYLESASAYEGLTDEMSPADVSLYLSMEPAEINRKTRLLSLSSELRYMLLTSDIDEGEANSICSVSDDGLRVRIAEAMLDSGVTFREAYENVSGEIKRTSFVARYKDLTVFENTIEHATETMIRSGIDATIQKNVTKKSVNYAISINKVVQS